MVKDRWLRVRFTAEEEQKLELWTIAYSESKSSFVRMLLQSLPAFPHAVALPLDPLGTTCDNRFLSNQLLAAGKDCGAVAWSALRFLYPLTSIFLWAVLTPQSSVAVPSCVNEALKTLDLSVF
jgi:hypothetical protein